MRILGLATALLCVATHAAAQSHEPAPKAGATPPASATAHAPATKGDDAHAPSAHGGAQPPAETAKKGPTVSRVSRSPKATADDAPAPRAEPLGSHGGGTKAGGAHVASGGRPKSGGPALATERSKPVVSGAERMMAKPEPARDHGAAPGPLGAPTTVSHGVAPAPAAPDTPAAAPAAVVKTPGAKGPVKLATVHGRLAAALAEFRPESHGGERDKDAHVRGGSHAKGAEPARPRIALTWPKARWRVEWPDADRVIVAWPE